MILPGKWGFFKNLGIRDCLFPGFFGDGDLSGMEIFFVRWDIPPKSHLCSRLRERWNRGVTVE